MSDRLQYHQQGLKDAPSHISYRFGFIDDDQENPQSRHEVSYEPGYVTGAYSYVDANNKLQYVKYETHPEHGFRIVQQWTREADGNGPDDGTKANSE
ncbi:hypothetical protein RDWZM_010091 [Blomia tropicalis]|uniref:Cuticle protein 7 n=1 Tax=Blomia tropicalis TaxID=40697 RepID=A0A9Q0RJR5_BLOTA|nr:hypothetical protein RDWZM_010091 [Blomia tropicalis]